LPGEAVLRKSSPSAFWGTPLVGHLNYLGVDTIITCGESTSGCVRASVVDGCTYRYRMIVVEEGVFDRHEATHAINLFDMHQKYADVLPLADALDYLAKWRAEQDREPRRIGPSDRPLIAIANRLPVRRARGSWELGTGGLVTALQPVLERVGGAWLGWDGGDDDVPRQVEGVDIDLHGVHLTRAQYQGYYQGFANRTIWPLFHDLLEQPIFDRGWWRAYEEVNRLFADQAAAIDVDPSALRWVQDYHLMLVPGMLRDLGVQGPIAFFLHIPFPPPELFARLPWREQILDGLLGADVVGFHTEPYRDNFVRAVARLHPDSSTNECTIFMPDGRRVRTVGHAISIDADDFASLATSDEVRNEVKMLREQFAGRRVLLGVDRLDYTKGIHERFQAIELLFERRPDLRRRVAFVQIAVPSRGTVREYRELRRDVEREVGRINGRFTEPGGEVPVYYLHRGVPRHRLVAYYQLADVALVTPLKDGMNLVAKEFVVCQAASGGEGALVLSEFTGAALSLTYAVRCNPFDVEGLSHRIETALELDPDERRRRLDRMASAVHDADIYHWVARQLGEVEEALAAKQAG
jgi:trehalose 6-phosphate synthase